MDDKARNLQSLHAEFHDRGKACRGFSTIRKLIDAGKNDELLHLLRFHHPIDVRGEELVRRFEIDALIEYYNLVLVAVFAGYIDGKLERATAEEIITTLGHPSVEPYYAEHYKYKMVTYARRYAQENKVFLQTPDSTTITVFNEFLSLNRLLKRDKDIERFMGMLDYVWYSGDTIRDVNEILSSARKLSEAVTAKHATEAQRAVWGFIKYTSFISQLKALLVKTEKYPLLQSALWSFHGYYFDRMNDSMKRMFNGAFDNLDKILGDPAIFRNILEEVYGTDVPEELSEKQLSEFAVAAVAQARADVSYVLNIQHGVALQEYFDN